MNELDGKTVAIRGNVVPLDFEKTSIKEFLLVPFVGACILVPGIAAAEIASSHIDRKTKEATVGGLKPATT